MTIIRKTAAAALALTMLATVAIPTAASARPWHHGYGVGAGILGALAIGAIAAGAAGAYDTGDCYIVRRRVIDEYGYVHIVGRRVCE